MNIYNVIHNLFFFETNLWGFSKRISIWEEIQSEGNFILCQNKGKQNQGKTMNMHPKKTKQKNKLWKTWRYEKTFRRHWWTRYPGHTTMSLNDITLHGQPLENLICQKTKIECKLYIKPSTHSPYSKALTQTIIKILWLHIPYQGTQKVMSMYISG